MQDEFELTLDKYFIALLNLIRGRVDAILKIQHLHFFYYSYEPSTENDKG